MDNNVALFNRGKPVAVRADLDNLFDNGKMPWCEGLMASTSGNIIYGSLSGRNSFKIDASLG